MSNVQQGTRGMSAGDWVRMQRLRGARNNGAVGVDGVLVTNKDIAPTAFPQVGYSRSLMIRKNIGTSKIRRPASNWTDFIASQTADMVLSSQTVNNGVNVTGITNTLTKLCNCSSTVLQSKVGKCTKCNGAVRLS